MVLEHVFTLIAGSGAVGVTLLMFLIVSMSTVVVANCRCKSPAAARSAFWVRAWPAPAARGSGLPWLTRPSQVLLFTCAASVISYSVRSVLSVAILPLATELGLDGPASSAALSAFFYGYVVSNACFAALSQRLRPGTLLMAAVSGSGFVTLLTPAAVALWSGRALIVCRALTGAMQGSLYPSIYAIYAEEYARDEAMRSRCMAVLGGTASIGIALSLLVAPLLLEAHGWQTTFQAAGCFTIPWTVLWLRSPMMRDCCESMSAKTDPDSIAVKADTVSHVPGTEIVFRILQTPAFYGVMCGHFAHTWMSYVMMAWLPTYLHDEFGIKGSSLALSCLPYVATAVASPVLGIGAPLCLRWAGFDLWGSRRLLGLGGLLLPAAAIFACPHIRKEQWPLPLVCVTACLAFATLTSVSVLATPLDIAGPKTSGIMFSMTNTVASVPGFVGVQVFGHLKDCCGWVVAFGSCTCLYVVAAFIYVFLGNARRVFD